MSVLGHVAIGVVTARRITPPGDQAPMLGPRMVVLAALALLPDVDLLLHTLAPSITFLEHRAATHSIAFAAGIGALIAITVLARGSPRPMAWGLLAGAVVASHGLLDSVGNSNVGVALLWPFSDARILAPWHGLPNPTLEGLLTGRGVATLAVEFLVFLPFWLYAFWPRQPAAMGPAGRPGT
jgi:inner membrane protein